MPYWQLLFMLLRNGARTELFREQADICLGLSILRDMELVWLVYGCLAALSGSSCSMRLYHKAYGQAARPGCSDGLDAQAAAAQSSLAQLYNGTALY